MQEENILKNLKKHINDTIPVEADKIWFYAEVFGYKKDFNLCFKIKNEDKIIDFNYIKESYPNEDTMKYAIGSYNIRKDLEKLKEIKKENWTNFLLIFDNEYQKIIFDNTNLRKSKFGFPKRSVIWINEVFKEDKNKIVGMKRRKKFINSIFREYEEYKKIKKNSLEKQEEIKNTKNSDFKLTAKKLKETEKLILSMEKELKNKLLEKDYPKELSEDFLGFEYLNKEDIKEAIEELDIESEEEFISKPDKKIKPYYYVKGWIPILADDCGNYIVIDYSPDVLGISGQIINGGCDESAKYVLADNIEAFMKLILQQLEEGSIKYNFEEDGWEYFIENEIYYHLTDFLIHLLYKNN